jgi:hypothetical protein
MALEGTFTTLPFADLVQLLGATRKTGTLHINKAPHWRKIYFRDGVVIVTSSDLPGDQIGRTLIALGKVREPEVTLALEEQRREPKLLGQILVEQGCIAPDVLRRYLADKAYELVEKLLAWNDAQFRFEEFAVPARAGVPLDMTAEELLMEGYRRCDELSRYREILPSEEVVLEKTGEAPDGDEGLLDQTLVGVVLRKLEQPRSVSQLKRELASTDFSVLAGINKLIEKGVLRPRRHVPSPPPDPTWLPDARKLVMAGLFTPAIELLRRGLAVEPANEAARALLERAEVGFEREITRKELPLGAVPEVLTPLESLGGHRIHPAEAFLLSRINGEVSVGALIDSTPLPPAETLRTLQHLVREGHIRLR